MGTETGTLSLLVGGKHLECEWERYSPEPGEALGTGFFVVTKATLICAAFTGHDPVRIDLTEFLNALGATNEVDSRAYTLWAESDGEDDGDGYREDQVNPAPT